MKKIGILGGTFDPPHNAHIMIAESAIKTAGMDEVMFMPNGDPPHKNVSVPSFRRLEMTRLAAEEACVRLGEDRVSVCEIEVRSAGCSYLADSLEKLKEMYADSELYFIAGGDAVSSMASWHGSARIFEAAHILAFKRAGHFISDVGPAVRYLEKRGAKVSVVDCELPDISSSAVRKLVKEHGNFSEYVPRTVAEYIKNMGLYI